MLRYGTFRVHVDKFLLLSVKKLLTDIKIRKSVSLTFFINVKNELNQGKDLLILTQNPKAKKEKTDNTMTS